MQLRRGTLPNPRLQESASSVSMSLIVRQPAASPTSYQQCSCLPPKLNLREPVRTVKCNKINLVRRSKTNLPACLLVALQCQVVWGTQHSFLLQLSAGCPVIYSSLNENLKSRLGSGVFFSFQLLLTLHFHLILLVFKRSG